MERPEFADYTKYYIVEALLKLMHQKDFKDINISELVKKAGVGRATFYRNFTDKESVITYYFSNVARKFLIDEKFIPRCQEDYYELILRVLKTLQDNKNVLEILIKSNLEIMLLNFLNEHFSTLLEEGYKSRNRLLPYAYSGGLYNISLQWLKNNCAEDIEYVAEAVFISTFNKSKYEELMEKKKNL